MPKCLLRAFEPRVVARQKLTKHPSTEDAAIFLPERNERDHGSEAVRKDEILGDGRVGEDGHAVFETQKLEKEAKA